MPSTQKAVKSGDIAAEKRLLYKALEQGLANNTVTGHRLLTISLPAPWLQLHSPPPLAGDCVFWSAPEQSLQLLGIGSALRQETTGRQRLQQIRQQFHTIRRAWQQHCSDPCPPPLIAFISFAFSPDDPMTGVWEQLPNCTLEFPELLLRQEGDRCSLSFTLNTTIPQAREITLARWMTLLDHLLQMQAQPAETRREQTLQRTQVEPTDECWLQLVGDATRSIRQDEIKKVVLARRSQLQGERAFDARRLLEALQRFHPHGMLFAFRRQQHLFVAATPERLVSIRNGRLTCDAIGGTCRRAITAAQDQDLGEWLLKDPKTAWEHRLVVDSIQRQLTPLCQRLSPSGPPRLKRLRHLQHLWTGVTGQLKPGLGLLDAAAALHPTAAVNGTPAREAGEWLALHEPFHRGWYSGAGGWMDTSGDGELAVLLRCASLYGNRAELYAGAGITGDSDPKLELAETELKFATMLEALRRA